MVPGERSFKSFNPRSYKRSDILPALTSSIMCCFQSTLLQEERRFNCVVNNKIKILSIHAPTRGATLSFLLLFWNPLSFNPRSYKRSDSEDQKRMITIYTFNPRSYKRSDKGQTSMFALIFFFQSTLLQEERQQKCTIFLMHLCNNYCIVSI